MRKTSIFAYTLLELIITVSIIAFSASLGVSFYLRQVVKANDSKRKLDLEAIQRVLEEYEKDHGCYVPTASFPNCGNATGTLFENYISAIPCDTVTGANYRYEAQTGTCPSWYRVYADLENDGDADSSFLGCSGGTCGPPPGYDYYVGSPNAPAP